MSGKLKRYDITCTWGANWREEEEDDGLYVRAENALALERERDELAKKLAACEGLLEAAREVRAVDKAEIGLLNKELGERHEAWVLRSESLHAEIARLNALLADTKRAYGKEQGAAMDEMLDQVAQAEGGDKP